jgi:hypothetical protein
MRPFGHASLTAKARHPRMDRVRQFARLPRQERRLLVYALLCVAAARIALWIVAFRCVHRRSGGQRTVARELAAIPVARLTWAVQAVARRIPGASCLTQALALHHLLGWSGRRAILRIGVAKDEARRFESHAWVELNGSIVIGDNGKLDRYAAILPLPSGEK